MKRRKILSAFLVSALIFTSVSPVSLVNAADTRASDVVAVDSTHFPDEAFRNYILENVDTDNSQSLSSDEIAACTSVEVKNYGISSLEGIEYLTNTTTLYCDDNTISSLDLSGLSNLKTLYCRYNDMTSLNLSDCSLLYNLNCGGNLLTSLELSSCTSLDTLACGSNQLETLDLSKNTALTSLSCEYNNLTSLNIENCTNLSSVNCGSNQLTELKLGSKPSLTNLNVTANKLSSLNVSECSALSQLKCINNQMLCLDLSSNTKISTTDVMTQEVTLTYDGDTFDLSTLNPDFDGSKVTDLEGAVINGNTLSGYDGYSDMTFNYDTGAVTTNGTTILLPVILHFEEHAYIVIDSSTFPDDNFRNYIASNFDLNYDGTLSMPEINKVTRISVGNLGISDLTGISYFTNLEDLLCYDNNLSSLDVSANTKLKTLDCGTNKLTELDTSHNPELGYLWCAANDIMQLNLRQNPKLSILTCSGCNLSSLDLSCNPQLTSLDFSYNHIQSIDLSNNPLLETLSCDNNNLLALDLSNNPALTLCSMNEVESICELSPTGSTFDLSEYDSYINMNNIANLQGASVNGTMLTGINPLFDITYTYDTNATDSEGNAITLNMTLCFKDDEYVELSETNFPDSIFRNCLSDEFDTDKNGFLSIDEIKETRSVSLNYTDLSNLEGIQYLEHLDFLSCTDCKLSSIDVSNNKLLTGLYLDDNPALTELDLSQNTALEVLFCEFCNLSTLNISNCTELTRLYCRDNKLTSLDVSNCSKLYELSCHANRLTSLNLTNSPSLTMLWCNDNRLKSLDLTQNPNLQELNIQYNQLMSLDLSGNPKMNLLKCRMYMGVQNGVGWYNVTEDIYLSGDTTVEEYEMLEYIYVYRNKISSSNSFNLAELGDFESSNIVKVHGGTLKGSVFTIAENAETLGFDYRIAKDAYGNDVCINVRFKLRDNTETTFEVWPVDTVTYTGKAKTPSPTVRYEDVTLEKGTDYTLSYSNNTNPGIATITVTGIGDYKSFTGKVTFTIAKASYTPTITAYSGTYNGKSHTITMKNVKSGSTIKYRTSKTGTWTTKKPSRTNVGKTTVYYQITHPKYKTITGSKTIVIKPKSTTISSVSGKSKSIVVKWKKQATQTSGYQIQYSTKSTFSSAKTVTVSGNKTTSKNISKLSGKKKYYVRIRTYKTVSGVKYYSAWSAKKTVTTKK